MSDVAAAPAGPREPDIDENGVDLAQVRAMLDLTPAERLSYAARFAATLLALRARNDEMFGA